MGCGCARVCRGRRAPDPPPQLQGSARRLLPAPNTGPQTPCRWSLQSRGPHPQASVPTSWPAAQGLWLLRTLSRPLSSLSPPPFLGHSLRPPGPHFPSPGSSLDCRGTPHPRRSCPLQPRPQCGSPPLTQAGRQRLLVGPHGPLDLPHGSGPARTRLRHFGSRVPRAPPASRPESPESPEFRHRPAPPRRWPRPSPGSPGGRQAWGQVGSRCSREPRPPPPPREPGTWSSGRGPTQPAQAFPRADPASSAAVDSSGGGASSQDP